MNPFRNNCLKHVAYNTNIKLTLLHRVGKKITKLNFSMEVTNKHFKTFVIFPLLGSSIEF